MLPIQAGGKCSRLSEKFGWLTLLLYKQEITLMSGNSYSAESGHPILNELENGTKLRHKYKKGDQAGVVVEATVQEGHVVYRDGKFSPTGAARVANQDATGKEYEVNGWRWWDYYDEENSEWRQMKVLRGKGDD